MATLELVYETRVRVIEFDAKGAGCSIGPVRAQKENGVLGLLCFPDWWTPSSQFGDDSQWVDVIAVTRPARSQTSWMHGVPEHSLDALAWISETYEPDELCGLSVNGWGKWLSETERLVEMRLNGSVMWSRERDALRAAAAALNAEVDYLSAGPSSSGAFGEAAAEAEV